MSGMYPKGEEIEVFREGWLDADARGLTGHRIEYGLRSLYEHLGLDRDVVEGSPASAPEADTRSVLAKAEETINGPRAATYGPALPSFQRIADFWSTYLGVEISALQVADLMILMKISRGVHSYHLDNYLDVCGYAALAEKMHDEQNPNPEGA